MKSILFSTPMVQAILDGRKTQTRRVIKPQPAIIANRKPLDGYSDSMIKAAGDFPAPKYRPGDILWVREKWRTVDYEYHDCKWSASIEYADGSKGLRVFWYDNTDLGIPDDCIYSKIGWRPSIHMPREAARLFLRVMDVRVERVQDISEKDAIAEGIRIGMTSAYSSYLCCKDAYKSLWDILYAHRGYGWDSNPWVWVYTFERISKEEADNG